MDDADAAEYVRGRRYRSVPAPARLLSPPTPTPQAQVTVQTRDEEGSCLDHKTLEAAFNFAADPTVWKISFTLSTGERVRLIRTPSTKRWVYQDIFGNYKG